MSAAVGFFILGTQEEFKIDVVYEPSVFEPLKFYCNLFLLYHNMWILMRTDLSQPAGQNMHQPLKWDLNIGQTITNVFVIKISDNFEVWSNKHILVNQFKPRP